MRRNRNLNLRFVASLARLSNSFGPTAISSAAEHRCASRHPASARGPQHRATRVSAGELPTPAAHIGTLISRLPAKRPAALAPSMPRSAKTLKRSCRSQLRPTGIFYPTKIDRRASAVCNESRRSNACADSNRLASGCIVGMPLRLPPGCGGHERLELAKRCEVYPNPPTLTAPPLRGLPARRGRCGSATWCMPEGQTNRQQAKPPTD